MLAVVFVLVLCCSSLGAAFQLAAKSSQFRSSSRLSSAEEKYCLNVNIHVEPSRREEFLQSIKNNQKGSLTDEIYCLQYTWGESENTPNTFHFHEEFIGKDGFETHTKSPHFGAWEAFAQSSPTPFTKDPEVKFYKTQMSGDKMLPTKKIRLALMTLAKILLRSKTIEEKEKEENKYCLNVNIQVEPSRREEFIQSIKNNQKGSLKDEQKCLQYTWGESENTPNTFHFHEEFTSREGFEAHTKSPHFGAWEAFAQSSPTPFTKDPEVTFYKTQTSDKVAFRRASGHVLLSLIKWVEDFPQLLDTFLYSMFQFFEQFDPNPITDEGKRRRERQIAIAAGEEVEDEGGEPIMPNFTGW